MHKLTALVAILLTASGCGVRREDEPEPVESADASVPSEAGGSAEADAGVEPDAGAVDPCLPNPCRNDGVCNAEADGYVCLCANGFSGPTCETNVDDCDPDPCLNGGTCTDGVDGFTCACPAGFSGATCELEIDECDPNPCLNGGTCTDGVASFTCACPDGFLGDRCELDDPCLPNPCMNSGTCFTTGTSYFCSCFGGWTGDTCEECGTPCSSRPDYYRDRFLSCFQDKDFCDRPYASCEEYCSGWMGCEGPLDIDAEGITSVVGPDEVCY